MRVKALILVAALVGVLTVAGLALGSQRQSISLARATQALRLMSAGQMISDEARAPRMGYGAPRGDLPGWRQIYLGQFGVPAALGRFAGCRFRRTMASSRCSELPRSDRSELFGYSDGTPDTFRTGLYEPSRVLSIHGGVLDFWLHTADGIASGAVVVPKIPSGPHLRVGRLYGAYAVRFRTTDVPDYHLVFMLWPDAYSHGAHWPDDGEIDFPEANLNQPMSGFFHFESPHGPGQYAFPDLGSYHRWHTAVIEWTPHMVDYMLDGRIVAHITRHIPHVPMHFLIQAETGATTPSPAAQGHVYVAWVAAYAPGA